MEEEVDGIRLMDDSNCPLRIVIWGLWRGPWTLKSWRDSWREALYSTFSPNRYHLEAVVQGVASTSSPPSFPLQTLHLLGFLACLVHPFSSWGFLLFFLLASLPFTVLVSLLTFESSPSLFSLFLLSSSHISLFVAL